MIKTETNIQKLTQHIIAAATGAAKGHAADLKQYVEAHARIIADGTKQIVSDRIQNKITDDDLRFAFDQIKESEAAINKAVGIALLSGRSLVFSQGRSDLS